MKKTYEKPIIEVMIFEYDVLSASVPQGSAEVEIDVGEKWFGKQ